MVLPHNPRFRVVIVIIAIALTSAMFYRGAGLEPVWWLVWLAPIPVLLVAPAIRAWQALAAAWIARSLAMLVFWHYWQGIMFSLWHAVSMVAIGGAMFALAVSAYRNLLLKKHLWFAAFAFPIVTVAGEYMLSLSQGTFGNTGYTQLNNLPILQLAAIGGLWGIGFTVTLFGSSVAILFHVSGRSRRRMAMAFAAYYVCTLSYGELRLHIIPSAPHSVPVGLVEIHAGADIFPGDAQSMLSLLQRYAAQAQELAARGAQIVILPEMTGLARDPGLTNSQLDNQLLISQADDVLLETAHKTHIQILLGLVHVTAHGTYNEARLYLASRTIAAVYRKHHLVPGFEDRATPDNGISVLAQPEGNVGIEICRDLDYPELARRYAHHKVGLILAPAWDQGVDALWHGHMSLMRAVEEGFSLVRDAKVGFLTATDDRGRILAEESNVGHTSFTTMIVSVPVRHDSTLYQSWGDWFAWLDLVALVMLASVLLWRQRDRSRPVHQKGKIVSNGAVVS